SQEDVTNPRLDSAAPARTQEDSAPLPSFDGQSSAWHIEPPTVPGNLYYPKSVPGYDADTGRALSTSGSREALSPALVLEHLARVGVFEPRGGARPAWEQAPRQKTRGSWVLILATLLVALGGGGGYYYALEVKAERLARANALNQEVSQLLLSATLDTLRATDDKLRRSFELDSLSK